jgi:hypothetical protein
MNNDNERLKMMQEETKNLLDNRVKIRPYVASDASELNLAASQDNHGVAAPTHVALKQGKIVGYLSINAVPTVLMWMNTKEIKVRDSLDVATFFENIIAGLGFKGCLIPMQNNSPIEPYMEKVGYVLASPDTTIYFKAFNQEGGGL